MTTATVPSTVTSTLTSTLTATLRRAVPAQRRRTARRDALATPWSGTALPHPSRLPQASGYPALAMIELSRLR